ncbi:MAG: phage holin family protein [Bacilli bacterium]|nr:phage holin family protein [Bacilli bacterium]
MTKAKKVVQKSKQKFINFMDWVLYLAGYTLVFILVTSLFRTIYIDSNHLIFWSTIVVVIIYLLNKTIKPILFTLTIPITGLTLGLFYPFINVFILKLVDWLLGPHFQVYNIWIAVLASILLSITNFIAEELLKKIVGKVKKHG